MGSESATDPSDSTGAICGNLLSTWDGVFAIPADFLRELPTREVLARLADDLALESTDRPASLVVGAVPVALALSAILAGNAREEVWSGASHALRATLRRDERRPYRKPEPEQRREPWRELCG